MSSTSSSIRKIAPRKTRSECEPPRRVWSASLTGLFVLAILYTAAIASPVIIPFMIGFMLSMILATPVRRLVAWKIPRPVASAAMILLVVVGAVFALRMLSEPATTWLRDVPNNISEVTERIRALTVPIQDVKDVAEEVEKIAQLDDGSDTTPMVKVQAPSFGQVLLDTAPRLVASAMLALFLAFLLLASGDAMLRKIIARVCALDDQRHALRITRLIQADLFRYLAAVTAVNAGLGLTTAAVLYALGVPNALLWGALAGLFNYAPLLGPAITIAILTIVGLTTFDSTGHALLVPFSYFVLTALEGQVVSPTIIGRRLALSPVVVLVSLVTLGWMWGIPGLLLAIPIVSSARIICANIPKLHPIADLLGR